MKIHFVTNACYEVITPKVRIFCDPWLIPGAFDGSWWQWPFLRLKPESFKKYTHLYVSHIHSDHCDPATLRRLPNKNVPVIIYKNPDGFVRKRMTAVGFKNFIELANGETADLGHGVKVTMYEAFAPNPFIDVDVPNVIDSSIVIDDGKDKFLNINDNTPDAEACHMLVKRHGHFKASTIPYSGVGPFPSSYENLTWAQKKKFSKRKSDQYLDRMDEIASIIKADIFFPAAGQMILGGRQWKKNEVLGVGDMQEANKRLKKLGYNSHFLEEGDIFDFDTEKHVKTLKPSKPTKKQIQDMRAARYWWEDAFRVPVERQEELTPLLTAARARLWKYQERYAFTTDWNMAIKIEEKPDTAYVFSYADNSPIRKMNVKDLLKGKEKFLMVTVPYNYLLAILLRHCHWNNAYHGCQVEWLRKPDDYKPEIQTLFSYFHL